MALPKPIAKATRNPYKAKKRSKAPKKTGGGKSRGY